MNYIIGYTLFMLGATVALFSADRASAGWIVLAVTAAGWALFFLYLIGVHHGKRTNDL